MVRKRSRTSRKYYDSDDNDSDSDFSLEDSRSQPAPKKYSLRQRKKALFIDDYDYEDDDEILPIPPTKTASDDEDFEVERELTSEAAPTSEYVGNSAYVSNYEDPTEDPNGLIDFEDMIRADIVVNKNRIDYDSMINKTLITIEPRKAEPDPVPVRSKRGRKPKKRPENVVDSSVLEPQTDVQEKFIDKKDRDYLPEEEFKKEKVQNSMEEKLNENSEAECSTEKDTTDSLRVNDQNDLISTENAEKSITQTQECSKDTEVEKTDNPHSKSQESVIKFNENYLCKPILNGTVVTTSEVSEPNEDPIINHVENEEDEDDDVVFVEDKRSEIIVLDD